MQGKKGSKRIEMIIKMVTEFKLTVVHFASPDPMQICACAWIYRWTKNCGKCGSGLRAAGPSRAVGRGPLGLRAARPLSHRRPWAVGLWAAGLLLAKPYEYVVPFLLLGICSLYPGPASLDQGSCHCKRR